jgi:hypothetical protein
MSLRQTNEWAKIRRHAVREAELLTRQAAGRVPVNLAQIAKQRAVREIRFRRLLVAGGISLAPAGFVIYVNCEPGEEETLTEAFSIDGTGAILPDKRRARLRFTIAHEIAHTFGYDLRRSPPTPLFNLKVPASVRSLELICNRVAGTILLPEWWLERQFRSGDWLDTRRLRTLAGKALVSRETVLRQLRKSNPDTHPQGLVVYVEKQSSVAIIRAISRHYRFRELFTEAKAGVPLQKLIYHPDLLVFGGEQDRVEKIVRLTDGRRARFQFECEPNANKPTASFFLTARLID